MALNRKHIIFLILIFLVIVFFFLDLIVGAVKIPINEIFGILFTGNSGHPEWSMIVSEFRLPKSLTAILVGSALAISGLQMQTIFRNPLAGPDVLGICAGASLGVALMVLGLHSYVDFDFKGFGNWALIISAWIGSGLMLVLMLLISIRLSNVVAILILGIMFGSAISAVVNILQYFSHESMLKAFIIWTMGSLGGVTKSQLYVLFPSIVIGLLISFLSVKMLNVLLLGENYAKTMGLNINSARVLIFLSSSILAGSVTAFCGPIAFIGIAIPHICRIIFKTTNHHTLLPACILVGGIAMLLSDLITQLPGKETTIPINSVTSFIGIPLIVWLVLKNSRLYSLN